MRPLFNPIPFNSKKTQTDGTTTSSVQQQAMLSNQYQGNPGNFFPNSSQFQSQIGLINPQISVPFQNSNAHLGNGNIGMPNGHFLNLQNGVMSHPGQFHGGFGQILNPFGVFQNMNGMNQSQPPGQFFPHNAMNPPQYLNQNAAIPNGQFNLQNPMQNMNQFVQMQMPNYPQPQVVPFNLHMGPNQVAQPMGPQNPNFIPNQQFGVVNSNGAMKPGKQDEHKLVQTKVDVNALKQTPNANLQLQGNLSIPLPFGSVRPQQTQKNFRPPFIPKSQGNPGNNSGRNSLNNNWKNSPNRKFTRNLKGEGLSTGSQKSQYHHMNNAKENFGFQNAHGRKGCNSNGPGNFGIANSSNQTGVEKRRSLPLNYTEEEIKRWREERRKNFPSKVNVDKKLTEKLSEPEISDRDAKIRRQQLKEILAKQAELGCEVAEIPSSYLSDSEKQVNGRGGNKRAFTKNERFQNKFNKRGRSRQNDRFAKKQRFADNDSGNVHDQKNPSPEKRGFAENDSSTKPTLMKKEPTLLEKLLSSDIRREKSCLLQVFRFMVINSFFKDWPENKKPLRFPLVVVEENGCEREVIKEKSSILANGVSVLNTVIEESEEVVREDGNDEHHVQAKEATSFAGLKGSIAREMEPEEPEEEGEIID